MAELEDLDAYIEKVAAQIFADARGKTLASVAISLKRIADALESIERRYGHR